MENEKIEEIRNKVEKHSLSISRVPRETKLAFMQLAIPFADDYGLLLKDLVDHYNQKDYFNEIIAAKIIDIERRLEKLEAGEKKEIVKTTFGGKVLKTNNG